MFKRAGVIRKLIFAFLLRLILLNIAFIVYFKYFVVLKTPEVEDLTPLNKERIQISKDTYKLGNSWLKKSNSGLWEMYVEGKSFEIGVTIGKLTSELIYQQESAFVEQIKRLIPSKFYIQFLRFFVAWFNRNIDQNISSEYLNEIYGISFEASDEFDFVGPKYQRILNYHAAHDIGHALQDMNIVGCTSFSVWNQKSADSSLIVGRNFDFYVGDEFAKNKIVAFYKPDSGYKFMMITWGGMIGAVSGMNENGLTVTINASKSDIPTGAATPISILAREILQYSKNIEDAYNIAKKRKTFVSEAIMIGSAVDNKTAIIEKSPEKIGIFYPTENQIICSNHYQCDVFKNDSININNILESSSEYRRIRVAELLNAKESIDYLDVAKILRDMNGHNDSKIGYTNEKAINQLIAHHSVIFNANKLLAWVSTSPYQMGEYVCYDLNKVFSVKNDDSLKNEINTAELLIPADSFIYSDKYLKIMEYKAMLLVINNSIKKQESISQDYFNKFISSNKDFYLVYSKTGDYYFNQKDYANASQYYEIALKKEITTLKDRKKIEIQLSKCKELSL